MFGAGRAGQRMRPALLLTGRFPDFKALSKSGNLSHAVDAVIVTHFHLDHCGALPYFTEVAGYSGPIFMTYPTKAIVPVMLEDFHKVMVDRRGEAELFSRRHISDCMRKVRLGSGCREHACTPLPARRSPAMQ